MAVEIRYWDANAFLGYLSGEPDKIHLCEPVLEAANKGQLKIVTSALTLTEVLWLKGQPKMDPAKRTKIEMYFRSEYIVVENVSRRIAEIARDVVWDYNVRPKDAIHVATAISKRVALMDTFDEGLIGISGKVGNPLLVIAKPHIVFQPDMLPKT